MKHLYSLVHLTNISCPPPEMILSLIHIWITAELELANQELKNMLNPNMGKIRIALAYTCLLYTSALAATRIISGGGQLMFVNWTRE